MKRKPYALITGASSGLGIALAEKCALRGYPLILVALPETGLEQVANMLTMKTGVEVHKVETDLTFDDGPFDVFNYCMDKNLQVGILINNARIGFESYFDEATLEYCTTLVKLNTLAVVKMTRLFLSSLKLCDSSFILNVSSLASYTPMPFKGIYAASKTFVNSFSCSLRTELKNTSVSISVLCPGAIPTNDLVRNRIRKHGWFARAGVMEPDKLAGIAIEAMFNKKQVIIPGRMNRISKLLMQIVPGGLQQEILYYTFMKKETISFN